MRAHSVLAISAAVLVMPFVVEVGARQTPQPPAAPAAPQAGAAGQEAGRGGPPAIITPPAPVVPEGFTSLFNGTDLTGWHISKTNHHGTTPDYKVVHGVIVGTQSPLGRGGILLTDKKYKNFEVYMEVKPDYGCDSGLFLRSSEAGEAYQVTMDYLPGGGMGGIYGERLTGVGGRGAAAGAATGAARGAGAGGRGAPAAPATAGTAGAAAPGASAPTVQAGQNTPTAQGGRGRGAAADGTPAPSPVVGGIPLGSTTPTGTAAWMKAWKREDWNKVRARIEGDVPHITVWINDQLITDFTDTANHAAGGATDGFIAIQVHGGGRWVPGGFWRWRAIGVKELP
jgi:hypothetical protein